MNIAKHIASEQAEAKQRQSKRHDLVEYLAHSNVERQAAAIRQLEISEVLRIAVLYAQSYDSSDLVKIADAIDTGAGGY